MTVSYSSFHLRYDHGQRAVWSSTPGLVEHFEGFGGGLPQDEVWRGGGPLLVPGREKTQRVLAWIRGLSPEETGRQNAWEAWGIIGPAGGFENWITFWDALAAPPNRARLDDLADAFNGGGRGAAYPPIPPRLAPLLTDVHSTQRDGAFSIKLAAPSELALLPWCCILGSVPPEEASLGAPRRRPLAFPLSYEALIIDMPLAAPRETPRSMSPLIDSMLACAQQGDVEGAMRIAADLRRMQRDERRKKLFQPPSPLPPAEPDITIWPPQIDALRGPKKPSKSAAEPSHGSMRRWRWPALYTLCAAILAVQIWTVVQLSGIRTASTLQPDRTSTAATTATALTATPESTGTYTAPTTSPASAAPVNCVDWWKQPAARSRVLQDVQKRLAKIPQIRLGNPAAALLSGQPWDANSDHIATALAVQLQIDLSQCGNVRVDGDAGKTTQKALVACKAQGREIKDGVDALQWLCGWTSQP